MKQAERIVIITGAAGGIGRALARDGDTVVAVDLPGSGVVELARGLGHPHLGSSAMSRERRISSRFTAGSKHSSRSSASLINNAAMGPTMAATVDTGVDAFRLGLAVNLLGPFVTARGAARRMRRGGAIVNVASMAGVVGNPKRNAYAASKAGLIS